MEGKASDWRPGPTVCRCCLTEGCYKDISTEYFWMGKREVYAEMLSDTLNISISFSKSGGPNSNSRLICEPCISRLRDASEFKRQVIDCEKTFIHHLDPGSSSKVQEFTVDLIGEVKVEKVKREKESNSDDDFDDRPDFLDIDTDDDLDDQPLTKLASKIPKKETVDILDLLDNSQITVKRKSNVKLKAPPKKIVKKKEAVAKPSASKPTPPKQTEKKKGSTDRKYKWIPKRKYHDHRDNAAIILECSNICAFRWQRGLFVCAYCSRTFADFAPLKEHVLEHPNKVEALRLVGKHTLKCDVSDLKCELCLRNIKDLSALVEHLIDVHNKAIIRDLGLGILPFLLITDEDYNCTHCNDTFKIFTALNKHMNSHFPNSVCPLCGKSFSDNGKITQHMKTHGIGTKGLYKCLKCDEVFSSAYDRNKHMLSSKHNKMRYRCPHCNEYFKSYSNRLKHLREFHDSKIEYPCGLCSAVFRMTNHRTKHIRQVHIKDKRFCCTVCPSQFVTSHQLQRHMISHNGERKYECKVCKKCYSRVNTLKEHMRIHNNDRRFVCMYCNNAFVQKCSLKSHMRTHHPNSEQLTEVKKPL